MNGSYQNGGNGDSFDARLSEDGRFVSISADGLRGTSGGAGTMTLDGRFVAVVSSGNYQYDGRANLLAITYAIELSLNTVISFQHSLKSLHLLPAAQSRRDRIGQE